MGIAGDRGVGLDVGDDESDKGLEDMYQFQEKMLIDASADEVKYAELDKKKKVLLTVSVSQRPKAVSVAYRQKCQERLELFGAGKSRRQLSLSFLDFARISASKTSSFPTLSSHQMSSHQLIYVRSSGARRGNLFWR